MQPATPLALVVDDSAFARRSHRALLESQGFTVVEAENGQVAVELVNTLSPRIVLLDLIMPAGMDGLATLQKLRTNQPAVPVVLVSANIQNHVRDAALNQGAIEVLTKPLMFDALDSVVRRALGRS